ncbi:MAG: hypothetical protein GQE15_22545 [Archangiaceae bacterium]|nr:hypothetical protein [Archangiaceae bacterium]
MGEAGEAEEVTAERVECGVADTHPDGPDLVRKRPGMYIGDTGPRGLQHLCLELIGNSIDQFLLHRATTVSVELDDGWLTVSDDGPGISVETDDRGLSFLESVFTSLHHTPTRDGPRDHVHVTHSGLGVGLAPVSALSERLEVESHRDGLCHRIAFARGVTVEPLQLVGKSDRQGLRIRAPAVWSSERPASTSSVPRSGDRRGERAPLR